MRHKKALAALALLCSPLASHATSHPAMLYTCGQFKVVAYKDIPAVTLNGSKMDDYQVKQTPQTPVISFSEYAAAGGSRTNYELHILSEAAVPALAHQWVDADSRPKRKIQVEMCSLPTDATAGDPGQSMMEILREEAEG
ncbi:hypothetical protein FR773_26195 (plasmid) [Leclercia adecarboxylata]|uniref:hypothetical protein n=1 Tax=Leclercia adecarboxylata TaxID=83655 RepID=UPI0012A8C064|nr:hypothetical protein [Leclercia adecarboxylata]QFH68122.1 hypothetical protein FR773_26195 [Leclercia adecarboxylata]